VVSSVSGAVIAPIALTTYVGLIADYVLFDADADDYRLFDGSSTDYRLFDGSSTDYSLFAGTAADYQLYRVEWETLNEMVRLGEPIAKKVTFSLGSDGTAFVEPDTVTFTLQAEGGTATNYVYGTAPEVSKPSGTGIYACVVTSTQVGFVRWQARADWNNPDWVVIEVDKVMVEDSL
jgi:hypothetical protein